MHASKQAMVRSRPPPCRDTVRSQKKANFEQGSMSDTRELRPRSLRGRRKSAAGGTLKVTRWLQIDQPNRNINRIWVNQPQVVLRRTLGLPLTEGDLRALFKRLDKVIPPVQYIP